MISDQTIDTINKFLSVCENDSGSNATDYRTIYLYHDGNNDRRQVTLGRGFTDDGGSLKKVILAYIGKHGVHSDEFSSRLSQFGKGTLDDDKVFLKLLGLAAEEQVMKDSQDEVFKEVYLNPALKWASDNGFTTNLSNCVVVDSFLHSGRMTPFLMQRFPEKKPGAGGNEHKWIKSYCEERLAWFTRDKGLLHTCMFRPRFFLDQIERNNWDLLCPLKLKGSKVC